MTIQKRRIHVTGIGLVTPLGSSPDVVMQRLRAGASGITPLKKCKPDIPIHYAAQIPNTVYALQHNSDPFIEYGMYAARAACEDAAISAAQLQSPRMGLVASSSKGGMTTLTRLLERGCTDRYAETFPQIFPSALAAHLVQLFAIKGASTCVVAACATGTHTIIRAMRMIEEGMADICLAGASDASIVPLLLAGYYRMGVYTPAMMRPYDKRRSGFIVGEGAGMIVLESEEHMRARNAQSYGIVDSCAWGQETGNALGFDPDGGALSETLKRAIGTEKKPIDYVNTHGTATVNGDVYEANEIKKAFGKTAYELSLSSTKSAFGHMLGAAGVIEFIVCLLSMRYNFVPPTVHYEKPDPQCDLPYIRDRAQEKEVRRALTFSMGFGGQISAIIVTKA